MSGSPSNSRWARRAPTLALAGVLGALLGAGGCAGLCADQGTREGAWGLVFRCSTPERP